MQLLVEFKAEVDGTDDRGINRGITALQLARAGGHRAAEQLLLKLGADPELNELEDSLETFRNVTCC